jgi:hypothetical protein
LTGSNWIKAGAGWALRERLAIYLKIIEAVAALHEAGLAHRDLKPSNILLDRRGEPVIVDFGLASRGKSGEGAVAGGTPGFSAPEQFDRDAPAPGARADVYALGVILYLLLTDRMPYDGDTVGGVMRAARESDPPLPEQFAPDVPIALERVCLTAMERDPAKRYPSAHHLAEDLRRYLRGETVAARPSAMAERFVEQLSEQVQRAQQWQRHGLITQAESRDLVQRLTELQRPDSPWIIDSRRLTFSQVSLYFGGWLVVVALTVGVWRSWDVLSSLLRVWMPWGVGLLLGAGGLILDRLGHKRVALAYLLTASLLVPLALGLMLRHTGGLSNAGAGMGVYEAAAGLRQASAGPEGGPDGYVVESPPPQGLFNRQMLCMAWVWLLCCVPLRWVTSSSAFTLMGALAGVGVWLAVWLSGGGMSPTRDGAVWAGMGGFVLPLGAACVLAGTLLSRAEQAVIRDLGRSRLRRSDAWPVLSAGVLLVVGGISLIAYYRPVWYVLPRLVDSAHDDDVRRRALAFIMNGVILAGLSWWLGRGPGLARERLALGIRWVLPSHFLASILVLEMRDAWSIRWVWLAALAAAAVTICFASVLKQWKPFLINGLAYLGVAYWQTFDEVHRELDDRAGLRLLLTLGLAIAGLAVMLLAWRGPVWVQTERSKRWLRRAAETTRRAGRPNA